MQPLSLSRRISTLFSDKVVLHKYFHLVSEAIARSYSVKKVFLETSQNSQKNTCARVYFLIKLEASACNFIKKETLTQVFFSEFCEISRDTFFTEQLWWLLCSFALLLNFRATRRVYETLQKLWYFCITKRILYFPKYSQSEIQTFTSSIPGRIINLLSKFFKKFLWKSLLRL